jgi:hypothetical protein
MQFYIEEFVEKSKELHLQARKAYISYIRSYSTYSSELKSIFYVKNLHLGHVAKCFGLREAPKEIADSEHKSLQQNAKRRQNGAGNSNNNKNYNENRKSPNQKRREATDEQPRRPRIVLNVDTTTPNENSLDLSGLLRNYKSVSEYSSGLEGQTKATKKRAFSTAFGDDDDSRNSNNRKLHDRRQKSVLNFKNSKNQIITTNNNKKPAASLKKNIVKKNMDIFD